AGKAESIDAVLQTHDELLKYKRDSILAALAKEAARYGNREEALRHAGRIEEPRDAVDALAAVADCLAQRNDADGTREAARRAQALIGTVTENWRRLEPLGRIAASLVHVGDLESWPTEFDRVLGNSSEPAACRAISGVALAMAEANRRSTTRQWLDRMPKNAPPDVQGTIALTLTRMGAASDGVALAERLLQSAAQIDSAHDIRTKT